MAEHCFSVTLHRGGGAVNTVIDVPTKFTAGTTPVVVLGHGAGHDLRSDFLEYFATELSERGLCVVRFNFPYKEKQAKRPPDAMSVLLDTYHDVILASAKRTGSPPGPLFIGGKSMGGRVAATLCAMKRVTPSGLVFLGYPLHPSGKEDQLRVDPLKSSRVAQLFVQGDRDPLCRIELLQGVRKTHKLRGALHIVPGGDHSFRQPRSRAGVEQAEMARAADIVVSFVRRVLTK